MQAFTSQINVAIRSWDEPWLRSRLTQTRFIPQKKKNQEPDEEAHPDPEKRHWRDFSELEWQEYVSSRPSQKYNFELMQRTEMTTRENVLQRAAHSFRRLSLA